MSLENICDRFGEKLSPPYTREDILKDQSLRSYLEDKIAGTIKAIAYDLYDKDVSELDFEIDGRMRSTLLSVVTRTDNRIRVNPRIFRCSRLEKVKLLREATDTYLSNREG